MPVTRKGAGGANASARMRFSGPTTAMKERRRRDTRTQRAFASRDAKNELASMKPEAEEAREERERHRERRSRAVGSSVFVARDAASRAKTRMMKRVRSDGAAMR